MHSPPSLNTIEKNYQHLIPHIKQTPVIEWDSAHKKNLLGNEGRVYFKCELLQRTGTFKLRGAWTRMTALTREELAKGMIAGTGGNHGVAVAHAARALTCDAKIVVPKSINPYRLKAIESLGALVVKVEKITDVIGEMNRLAEAENRVIIHPFEHPLITLGTATLGYEFLQQVPSLDAIVVPIGGGGLASGVAVAAKLIKPEIKVYGVEPEGANSMSYSLTQSQALPLPKPANSIADSLCAPAALPYSFSLCQRFIDEVVLVSDDQLRDAMRLLFEELKFACEPSCAAATAGLLGPLKERCQTLNTGVLLCGSNIDSETFCRLLS